MPQIPGAFQHFFMGPFLIGLAAFLWATDALFRYPASAQFDATFLVLIEHLFAVIVLLPWILIKQNKQLFSLTPQEWIAAFFCGTGGSAFATLFFTASFRYVNPSVSILLQKLQPVLVVLIAAFFLGERPSKKFYLWGSVALGAGIVLSFPDLNFGFLLNGMDLHSQGIRYALLAATIWAASTVGGKILVQRLPTSVATFWRFAFGLVAVSALINLTSLSPPWHLLLNIKVFIALAYLSLIPGLLAMIFYYRGLAQTQASVSTFVELVYPIGAVILNTLFLQTPLDTLQVVAGIVLLFAVTLISI